MLCKPSMKSGAIIPLRLCVDSRDMAVSGREPDRGLSVPPVFGC